jgi:hypothetical protein
MGREQVTWRALLLSPGVLCLAIGADTVREQSAQAVEVVLERASGQQWAVVDARTVFRAGEELRFRFRANFSGFLYVLDRTSTDQQLWLYPTPETGENNDIVANREYLIPATGGSFRIPDRPGYDSIFWIVSPVYLNGFTGLPAREKPSRPLLPRCRDECLDAAAGARAADKQESFGPLRSRELTVKNSPESTKVQAAKQGPGPLIYEIRIAHR